MKLYKSILAVFTVLLLISFSNSNEDISLEKIWVFDSCDNYSCTYINKKEFDKYRIGYEFKKDGIIKVRQNMGSCGTPPIYYEIVEGKWNMASDSIITIVHSSWKGKTRTELKMLKLTENKLVLKDIKESRLSQ